jgi:hypothetical protein
MPNFSESEIDEITQFFVAKNVCKELSVRHIKIDLEGLIYDVLYIDIQESIPIYFFTIVFEFMVRKQLNCSIRPVSADALTFYISK